MTQSYDRLRQMYFDDYVQSEVSEEDRVKKRREKKRERREKKERGKERKKKLSFLLFKQTSLTTKLFIF